MQQNPFSQRITRIAASGIGGAQVVFLTVLLVGFLSGCKTGDGYYDTPRNNNPAYGSAGAASGGGFGSSKRKQKALQQRVDDVHAAIDRQFDEE